MITLYDFETGKTSLTTQSKNDKPKGTKLTRIVFSDSDISKVRSYLSNSIDKWFFGGDSMGASFCAGDDYEEMEYGGF